MGIFKIHFLVHRSLKLVPALNYVTQSESSILFLQTESTNSMERSLLKKLLVCKLVTYFSPLYGTSRFITVFTTEHLLPHILSQINPVSALPGWRYISLFFSHLCPGLSSGLFVFGFDIESAYTYLLSAIRATCPAHLVLFCLITLYHMVRNTDRENLCSFVCYLLYLRPKYLPQHLNHENPQLLLPYETPGFTPIQNNRRSYFYCCFSP